MGAPLHLHSLQKVAVLGLAEDLCLPSYGYQGAQGSRCGLPCFCWVPRKLEPNVWGQDMSEALSYQRASLSVIHWSSWWMIFLPDKMHSVNCSSIDFMARSFPLIWCHKCLSPYLLPAIVVFSWYWSIFVCVFLSYSHLLHVHSLPHPPLLLSPRR